MKKTKAIQQMLDTQAEWKEVVKKANAKALAKHQKFQEGMSENPIYPVDRYDSDAEFFDRPIDWQEQQTKDIKEMDDDSIDHPFKEDDDYADRGLHRSQFIDNKYT